MFIRKIFDIILLNSVTFLKISQNEHPSTSLERSLTFLKNLKSVHLGEFLKKGTGFTLLSHFLKFKSRIHKKSGISKGSSNSGTEN